METIRSKAQKCAAALMSRASMAGTADLFQGCLDWVVDMAIQLNCNNARTTGTPGFGILFEATGQNHPGRFTFFATRRKLGQGIVALAISEAAVGARAPQLHALVDDLCRRHGVAVTAEGNNTWPAIGFLTVEAAEPILREVSAFLRNEAPPNRPAAESKADPQVLQYINLRRGQPEFRNRLLAAYDGRCVITGCDVVEALEAAHITPYSEDGSYATSNGLLMRADIHTLFDLHLLSVCPDTNVIMLNPRLRGAYGQFEERKLAAPTDEADRPEKAGLAQHLAVWQTLL